MKFYLPTKEECDNIVKNNEAFYKTETVVEGQNVVLYDYRLATINDFKDYNAFELRGLTFVEQSDGTWKRNILLNKFFNVSQTEGWMYEDLKDKKITKIQEKLDGSVISFVQFENGTIRAKSKMSFISEQAMLAQKFYDENYVYREFVEDCFNSYLTPVFELVGYENTIVVNYEEPYELRLIQIRREDGTYLTLEKLERFAIAYDLKYADSFYSEDISLYDLLGLKEVLKDDIEGWVITFSDSQMAKIKTKRYLELHSLIGPDAFRENILIQSILNETIDDVVSALQDGHKKDKILEMTDKVSKDFNHLVQELKDLYNKFVQKYKGDKRSFAIENKDNFLFSSVMILLKRPKQLEEKDFEEVIKEYILKRTSKLSDAKKYLENL